MVGERTQVLFVLQIGKFNEVVSAQLLKNVFGARKRSLLEAKTDLNDSYITIVLGEICTRMSASQFVDANLIVYCIL